MIMTIAMVGGEDGNVFCTKVMVSNEHSGFLLSESVGDSARSRKRDAAVD